MSQWRVVKPDFSRYRPPAGLSARERSAEQNMAAGGEERRHIQRPDGTTALASVALRTPPRSRRVYAYLRWSVAGSSTREVYIGDVSDAANRADALRRAWSLVHTESSRYRNADARMSARSNTSG
jgi:DNA mismatch endonuclease, patch repair protein